MKSRHILKIWRKRKEKKVEEEGKRKLRRKFKP